MATGNSTVLSVLPSAPSSSTAPISRMRPGGLCPSRPAGRCTASIFPSTPTSFILGRKIPKLRLLRRTTSIPWAAIASGSRSRRIGTAESVPPLRRRRFLLLRMAQRQEARLPRRQPYPCRIRYHPIASRRGESARRGSVSLRRWRIPGRPGYVAHERYLPRCIPLVYRCPACTGFRGLTPISIRVPRLRTHGSRIRHQRILHRVEGRTHGRTPRRKREPVGRPLVKNVDLPASGEVPVDLSVNASNPQKWSAETPYLYKLLLTLKTKPAIRWK